MYVTLCKTPRVPVVAVSVLLMVGEKMPETIDSAFFFGTSQVESGCWLLHVFNSQRNEPTACRALLIPYHQLSCKWIPHTNTDVSHFVCPCLCVGRVYCSGALYRHNCCRNLSHAAQQRHTWLSDPRTGVNKWHSWGSEEWNLHTDTECRPAHGHWG